MNDSTEPKRDLLVGLLNICWRAESQVCDEAGTTVPSYRNH